VFVSGHRKSAQENLATAHKWARHQKLSFMFYVMNEKLNVQIHEPTQMKSGEERE
jgi:hypothetical protein